MLFFNFVIAPIHIGKIFIVKGETFLESPPAKAVLETTVQTVVWVATQNLILNLETI